MLSETLLLICSFVQSAIGASSVLDDVRRHVSSMITDKRFHYSIVLSECDDFLRFGNDRVTFLRNAPGTKWFQKMQREIIVSCKDERPDDKDVHVALAIWGHRCGYAQCLGDPASQVIDNFNYEKRVLVIIRSYRNRLQSNNGIYLHDKYLSSLRETAWKVGRNVAFATSFSKTFLIIRGPNRMNLPGGQTFKFSEEHEAIHGTLLFDSTPTRGSPKIGCIMSKVITDSEYQQPFVIKRSNSSQTLHFGLHGINVNKGRSQVDTIWLGVACAKFDIIVQDCRAKGVSCSDSEFFWVIGIRDVRLSMNRTLLTNT